MLALIAVALLAVTAMVSSFSFVFTRESRFQENFAAGQRLAELAVMAHNFAQNEHFRAGVNLDGAGDLYAGMNLPDNFAFSPTAGTSFEAVVLGREQAPVNATSFFPQPSAYVHFKIRTPAGRTRLPSDTIAFLSGASKNGLTRMGIVDRIPAGATCDGAGAIRVVWGSEPTACLRDSHLTAIGFTDVQSDDVIVPSWEIAIARTDSKALFRFPQPERPDLRSMATSLAMNGGGTNNDIQGVGDTRTEDINNIVTADIGTLVVRQGAVATPTTATMTQGMTVGAAGTPAELHILNQTPSGPTDPALAVQGGTTTQIGNNFNVAADIRRNGAGPLNAVVDAGGTTVVSVNRTGDVMQPVTVELTDLTPDVQQIVARNICDSVAEPGCNQVSVFGGANVTRADGRLNITGTIDTSGGAIQPQIGNADIDVYAANVNIAGTNGAITPGNATWNVGSIEQSGAGEFRMNQAQVADCRGRACPDNETGPPGGGL